jgi:glycosyltransferase involved in cell wall biosynthesis
MMVWVAAASCLLAIVPAILFVRNLSLYAPLPKSNRNRAKCAVLIPARNEADNIPLALRSVLQSDDVDLEVIVLDDNSTDRTAEIVRDIADKDPRVRLETAGFLPAGWCGKNFACYQLAQLARNPLLIFMDADVRISRSDSLSRLAQFMGKSKAALVSGVPFEETCGIMEKLIVPLIHFVLLAFLPLRQMRACTDPRFGAGCGQIVVVRRDAYEAVGGHAAIAGRLHDGVALVRQFRSRGFATDLIDATDTFHCRMYRTGLEVWNGFAKNAHEGLGSPRMIVPATLLLLGGQVLPLCLLSISSSPLMLAFAVIGTAVIFIPRLFAAVRFRQSLLGALLHPFAICALLAIQWSAFLRSLGHRPAVWKDRSYYPAPAL